MDDIVMIRDSNGLYIKANDFDSLPYLFEKYLNVQVQGTSCQKTWESYRIE